MLKDRRELFEEMGRELGGVEQATIKAEKYFKSF